MISDLAKALNKNKVAVGPIYVQNPNGEEGSRELVNIIELLENSNIPSDIINGLDDLYSQVSLFAYYTLRNSPVHLIGHEGRGVVFPYEYSGKTLNLYLKGSGNVKSLDTSASKFYPAYDGLFDEPNFSHHPPRVTGAESIWWAADDLLMSTRIFHGLILGHNLKTFDEVLEKNLTIPQNVVFHHDLTKYVKNKTNREVISGGRWITVDPVGSVLLIVPSFLRTYIISDNSLFTGYSKSAFGLHPGATELEELHYQLQQDYGTEIGFEIAGNTLRSLVEHANTIVTPPSAHMQNFFLSLDSICAQSDNSDIMPLEYLTKQQRVFMIYSTIRHLLPEESLGYLAQLARKKHYSFFYGVFGDEHKAAFFEKIYHQDPHEATVALAYYLLNLVDQNKENIVRVKKNYRKMSRVLHKKIKQNIPFRYRIGRLPIDLQHFFHSQKRVRDAKHLVELGYLFELDNDYVKQEITKGKFSNTFNEANVVGKNSRYDFLML